VESLKLRGYTVVEKGSIRGRSGLNYTFDVVARGEGDQVNHTIVMDYLFSPNEVGIDRVLAFDAKAHDANTDENIVVVFSGLSTEARKFTQYQHIKYYIITQVPNQNREDHYPSGKWLNLISQKKIGQNRRYLLPGAA